MPYSVLPISGVDLNGITYESFEYTNGTTLIGIPSFGPLGSQTFGSDGKRYVFARAAATIPAGTTEESLRIQQNREDEEKQRREQADRLSPSAELRPLFTSNMANVRGLLPLGNNSAPILSNSGKSAIVPGVGVVPVPEPTNKKGRKKAGKRTKISTQELGLSTANEYEPIQELNIDSLIRGTNAATINSNKAPTMEAPDATENENVNLGRQFITTKTTDQVAAEQEGNQTFDAETEGLLKEVSKKRK